MIIKPMIGSENINNSPSLSKAKKELEKIFPDYFKPFDDKDNQWQAKDCKEANGCLIEIYYYFNSSLKHMPSYRNGIWIRANKSDNWIFVLVNENDNKKADIHSATDLKCPNFKQEQSEYKQLPIAFSGAYIFIEENRVIQMDYITLMQEIIKRLPCVCK